MHPATGVDIKHVGMSKGNREQSCAIESFPNSFHGPEVGIVFALSIGFPSVVGANGTTNADCRCRDADSRGVGYAPRSIYTSNETAVERNGGKEEAGGSVLLRNRQRQAKERTRFPIPSISVPLPFPPTRSVFPSVWRERGSFSLSESLAVCTSLDVYGRLCSGERSRGNWKEREDGGQARRALRGGGEWRCGRGRKRARAALLRSEKETQIEPE